MKNYVIKSNQLSLLKYEAIKKIWKQTKHFAILS